MDAAANKKSKGGLKNFVKNQALLIGLILIVVFFSLTTTKFLTKTNLLLILQQATIVGIAGTAMTFVLVTGNFDLCMGATITLSVLLSIDLHEKIGCLPAVLIALGACMLVGLVNGLLVGYLRIPSMIATLGTQTILSGAMLIYTGGQLRWINDPSSTWYQIFGRTKIFNTVPVSVVILVAAVLIFEYILVRTAFGVKVKAVGGNALALRYSGSDDRKIIVTCFVLAGLMGALAGLVMGSRTMKYQTEQAFGYEFDCISAVILGGTSLSGGSGSVVKTLLGVVIIAALNNGFLMFGLPYYFQWVVQGLIILVMVYFDVLSQRREGLS